MLFVAKLILTATMLAGNGHTHVRPAQIRQHVYVQQFEDDSFIVWLDLDKGQDLRLTSGCIPGGLCQD